MLFATAVLGAQLWERQVEILRSIQSAGGPPYDRAMAWEKLTL